MNNDHLVQQESARTKGRFEEQRPKTNLPFFLKHQLETTKQSLIFVVKPAWDVHIWKTVHIHSRLLRPFAGPEQPAVFYEAANQRRLQQ